MFFLWSAESVGTLRFDGSSWASSSSRSKGRWESASTRHIEIPDFPAVGSTPRKLNCIAWRNTGGCSPNGQREPLKDRNCSDIVPSGASGYCEVEDVHTGEHFRVMQRHCNSIRNGGRFRCSDALNFVDFQVQTHKTIEAALAPNFSLPNVNRSKSVARDGIVMVVYPKLLPSAYATIRVLRDVMGCRLPIEIWFRPDEMLPDNAVLAPLRHLSALGDDITFQEIQDPLARRFVSKVYAIYHSAFDRVLFLDADNVPTRDPSYLFEDPEFVKTGAIFWPDFWHPSNTMFNIHKDSLLWQLLDTPFVDMFEQESGQLLVDRRRHAAALELVRFYAFHRPDLFSEMKLVWGDKDHYRLAWLKLGIPFHMIQTPPGMVGVLVKKGGGVDFCGMTMAQYDTNGTLLFLHRNHQKLVGGKLSPSAQAQASDSNITTESPEDTYPDPGIWTHMVSFRKGSNLREYVVEGFSADLSFQKSHRCYGRRDVYSSSHFEVQEVADLEFFGLETHLRHLAAESSQFT
ncbi:hypothetical protein ON010_g15685 [Phytophthora cinnamomi]|nr:hypothetical protein ON010_g15685 [Phytophthora cinnamomi]